jgi:hypothetical protein
MCDLTGFVIGHPVSDITASGLASVFMSDVLLKVGLCGMVVVDAASAFLSVFEAMCNVLNIKFHAAARGNHQAVSVERFFRYLNKALTIASSERNSNQVWVETSHCAIYAWNSSCIDGTDIMRSVAAVGREFKFPLDLSLQSEPKPVDGSVFAVHAFLRLAQENSTFAGQILRLLTEERRTYHRERANEHRAQRLFALGDQVMVRVQVNSNAESATVAKLTPRMRGPYTVVGMDPGAYYVRRSDKTDGAILKYPSESLSLLPPCIRPVEPLDGCDLRFLNQDHAPIPHPFEKAFDIKLYNESWFHTPPTTVPPKLRTNDIFHQDDTTPESTILTTVSDFGFFRTDETWKHPIVIADHKFSVSSINSSTLHEAILLSQDKLFFVRYVTEGTLRARWYLVSVDIEQTQQTIDQFGEPSLSGIYYVHFYARHPSDKALPDSTARWWPEWHQYTTDSVGVIDYGKRVLFAPSISPDPDYNIAWADTVNLQDPSIRLLGPFDFTPPYQVHHGRTPSFRQYVPEAQWIALTEICVSSGIVPPQLFAPTPLPKRRAPKPTKRKRS